MSDKDKVLAKYPDAYCDTSLRNHWIIWSNQKADGTTLCLANTNNMLSAWADAASKLGE